MKRNEAENKVIALIIIWIPQVWHWSQDIIKLTRNPQEQQIRYDSNRT
jgi:hypothetical protein